jgi:cytochrome c oxidase subunit 2
MSRETLVAGAARMTPESLHAWIADPDHVKPGSLMPAMNLEKAELDQLVAYLTTLR